MLIKHCQPLLILWVKLCVKCVKKKFANRFPLNWDLQTFEYTWTNLSFSTPTISTPLCRFHCRLPGVAVHLWNVLIAGYKFDFSNSLLLAGASAVRCLRFAHPLSDGFIRPSPAAPPISLQIWRLWLTCAVWPRNWFDSCATDSRCKWVSHGNSFLQRSRTHICV